MFPRRAGLGTVQTFRISGRHSGTVEFLEFSVRKLYAGCSNVLFHMLYRRSTWNGKHNRRSLQQPRQRDLHGGHLMRFRYPAQNLARNFARPERKPRNKSNAVLLTIIDNILPLTI